MPLPPADLPCPPDPPALIADQGALVSAAGGCDARVVETLPANSLFSWGGVRVEGLVAPWLEVRLWWRRLSDRPGAPLEIAFPGGVLMLRDGAVGWWEDLPRFAGKGWVDVPYLTSEAHELRLVQRGSSLRAWIDGEALPAHTLAREPAPGRLSFGLKGGPGDRARMWIDRVEVVRGR